MLAANVQHTDSHAASLRLAAGSHVLCSSEKPFHRMRYSTPPRMKRRPMTASTSKTFSSVVTAYFTSTAGATIERFLPFSLSFRVTCFEAGAIFPMIRQGPMAVKQWMRVSWIWGTKRAFVHTNIVCLPITDQPALVRIWIF